MLSRLSRTPFRYEMYGFGIGFIGGVYGDDGCYVTRRVPTPFGYRLRIVNVCEY